MTFDEFAEEQGPGLLRLAYVLTGDRHLAEDLAQTALADAYRHWAKVSGAADPLAYARRILVNAHLSWRRRRSTTEHPRPIRDADMGSAPDPTENLAARAVLRTRVAQLPRRARTVLVLRYWADLDDAHIAAAMGVCESTVRATASRALANLRETTAADFQEAR